MPNLGSTNNPLPMPRRPWTLTAKLVATGTVFLLLALASVGLTLWVAWKLEGGAAAVNEAGRMRMQTYRLALAVTSTDPAAHAEAAARAQAFSNSIALLAAGDTARPLAVPWSTAVRGAFSRVQREWETLRTRWLQGTGDATVRAREADEFVARVDALVLEIEHEIARWTALLNLFQVGLMAMAIASAVAVLYAGYVLVLDPVARLRRGLAAVQAGDLSARVTVDADDEFGELSAGFNEMAQTLQALYGNLEAKVREKTERLQAKQQRLADLYEASAMLAQANTLEELGTGFARRVRRIARADAAAVRVCDPAGHRFMLLAADNLPVEFTAAEACVQANTCACGAPELAAGTRTIRIAPASSAYAFRNCRKAGYGSVVAVPVRLHDKLLGELDLFYREPVAPDAEERELLDSLASHMASAMESLRAAALEREAAVAGERSMLASELHDSIAQSLAFMKIQVQLLRQATQRGDHEAVAEIVGELDAGVRESYADVRELLLHFRTRTSSEDIEAALRTTLSKFEHHTGLAARLEVQGHGVPLAPDVQVQVLHIVQEALSNVRKHARARHVVVRVMAAPHWRFEVQDDGMGFDPADAAGETHVGLRIMRERAERIGAEVAVQSGRGRGCTVSIELPRDPAGAPAGELEVAA